MKQFEQGFDAQALAADEDDGDFARRVFALRHFWRSLAAAFVVGGAIAYGVSFAFKPTYVSEVLFIPPQQQNGASSALASLGALSGLIGGAGVKSTVDQYITMLQGVTVSDHIIKRFGLAKEYGTEFAEDARRKLGKRVAIAAGKKDGLLTVDVEDEDPARAAAIANRYVDELREVTDHLAVTEAQQRRVFFEHLLDDTKQKLTQAQVELEQSGLSQGAIKVEPRSAADGYARLRAELTSAEVKLQVARGSFANTAPQVVQLAGTVQALQEQVSRLEASQRTGDSSAGYIGKYRDFKYQETLFDLFAKQYELARVDESREGGLVQVVDEAQPAERKHFPRRSYFAAIGGLVALLAAAAAYWRRTAGLIINP